jgi:hypothetical protein
MNRNRLKVMDLGWCRGAELNRRHTDFQSVALPTELPRHSRIKTYGYAEARSLYHSGARYV